MQTCGRAHPITVVGNLWRVMYLIIIPALRGFFLAVQDNLAGWLEGAWLDIVILLLMVGIAILRWRQTRFWWDEKLLHIQSGMLFTRRMAIPWERIVTASSTQSFYLRPFRAVRLRLDTVGGGLRNADFTILLDPDVARLLLTRHGGSFPAGEGYSPGTRSILALSLLNSNSLGGIVFIATFISQSGRLLGNEFSEGLIGTFEEVARTLAFGLPPAAAAIAWLLLGGWAAGFLLTFTRYRNISVNMLGNSLRIKGGLLTRREYSVSYRDINYLDIRQSLTTKLFGLYSLYISAVGYAKRGEDISCLIPTEGLTSFQRARLRFFPRLTPAPRMLIPEKKGVTRFILPAVLPCLGIPLLTALVLWKLESWGPFIFFTGAMAMVPSLFFLTVRITDFCTGGISKTGDTYTLRYSKGFYLHTVVAEADKIAQVELRQGFFQRAGGSCDVLVYTRAEGRVRHRLRSIRLEQARKLFA